MASDYHTLDLTADLPLGPPSPEHVAIYALIDPRDGLICYIGKANDPALRFRQHTCGVRWPSWRTHRMRTRAWIRKLHAAGLEPGMRVLVWVDRELWAEAEVAYIGAARDAGCRLLNLSAGGNGPTALTLQQRAAIRARQLGRPMSQEAYAKLVALNRRKADDPAFRQKLSAAHRRNMADPGFAARQTERAHALNVRLRESGIMHLANLKRWQDHPEMREAIAESSRRNWDNPECRARMTAAVTAYATSPEVRARRSEGARQRWADPEWRAGALARLRTSTRSEEARRAQGEALRRAHIQDPTIRQRQSESNKRYFAEHPERAAHISACKKEYWRRWREERARSQSDQFVQLPLF